MWTGIRKFNDRNVAKYGIKSLFYILLYSIPEGQSPKKPRRDSLKIVWLRLTKINNRI